MNKGFAAPLIVIGILIIAVVAGVVGYSLKSTPKLQPQPPQSQAFTTSTPSPTDETVYTDPGSTNWKTYTNTKYAYSFKYPATWAPIECNDFDNVSFGLSFCETDAPGTFSLNIIDGTNQPLIKISDEFKVKTKNIINLDNKQGEEVLVEKIKPAPGADEIITAAVAYNNRTYLFNLQDITEKKTFNQILSTFKFLD